MRYVKWALWAIVALCVVAVLDYSLPQHDNVRVTGTFEKRIDYSSARRMFWANPPAKDSPTQNRDVFFIQTIRENGKPMVYRNEDTGWGWPPYFKFDSSNLQAKASDLKSTANDPQWVRVTRYGWRLEFLSAFPNAVSIKPISGPDVKTIPWLNIIIIVVLLAIFWALRVRWIRFRERRIDPILEDMEDSIDNGRSRFKGLFSKKNSK